MSETDPGGLADHLEDEADELERRSEKLEHETEDVAQEWESKRSDPNVPGAPAPPQDEDEREGGRPPTGAPSGKGDDD